MKNPKKIKKNEIKNTKKKLLINNLYNKNKKKILNRNEKLLWKKKMKMEKKNQNQNKTKRKFMNKKKKKSHEKKRSFLFLSKGKERCWVVSIFDVSGNDEEEHECHPLLRCFSSLSLLLNLCI